MKKKPRSTDLPLKKIGDTQSCVVCSHHPPCENAEACIRRTMEYAMGKRAQP